MDKKQFEKLKAELLEKGYKVYDQHWNEEDYVLGKPFHMEDNKWDDERYAFQILISVYDWTNPDRPIYDRLPANMKQKVGLEVHVDMSRTIDERFELVFPFHEDDTIEDMEQIAEGFYLTMCLLVPKPREEEVK